jgi:hypothetical protein
MSNNPAIDIEGHINISPGTQIDFESVDGKIEISFGSLTLVFSDSATLCRLSKVADQGRDSIKMNQRQPMIYS